MTSNKWVWNAVALTIALSSPPVAAKPAQQGKAPKTTTSKPVKANASKPVKTQTASAGASAKPVKTQTKAAKAQTKGPKATKTSTATASTTPPSTGTTAGTTTTTTTTTTTNTGTNAWVPNNPVAQKLSTKPNLLSKVQGRLPAGTNLNQATAGFKNFGQFMAAVNVSNNLGIAFADLKASMTGTTLAGRPTNEPTLSLGQSIQKLRPGVDADTEAARATTQANIDAQ